MQADRSGEVDADDLIFQRFVATPGMVEAEHRYEGDP
jgi:hypothetical protein